MSPVDHNVLAADTVRSPRALSRPRATTSWAGKRAAATANAQVSTRFKDETLTRILVPVTFAESMPLTVYIAWSRVRRTGGGIWLLHVVQADPRLIGMCDDGRHAEQSEIVSCALHRLRNLAALLERRNVTIGTLVRVGQTSEEVCTVAEALRVDVIVIGETVPALAKIDQRGSVAELIERNASCAVMRLPFRPGA